MSVLFLDIDGVLNSEHWYRTRTSRGESLDELDPKAVALLVHILQQTGCCVVISSTWRRSHSLKAIMALLTVLGMPWKLRARFIGMTPVMDGKTPSGLYTAVQRGHEIQAWLDANPTETFAILDDDSDMAHLYPHLIKTSRKEGLTPDIADTVITKLTAI